MRRSEPAFSPRNGKFVVQITPRGKHSLIQSCASLLDHVPFCVTGAHFSDIVSTPLPGIFVIMMSSGPRGLVCVYQ